MMKKSAILMMLASIALVTGCHTSAIRARNLPPEFLAKERPNNGIMDLSRAAAPGVSDALIGPDDLLKVTVTSGRQDERPTPTLLRVASDGTVDVPLIGPTKVAGMEAFAASQSIVNTAVERAVFVRPVVTVEVASKAVKRVTVLGAVNKPGVQELPYGNCDLVNAIASAGGLTKDAGTSIEIIRQPSNDVIAAATNVQLPQGQNVRLSSYESSLSSEPQVISLDLAGGQAGQLSDTRLSDRDVVMIGPRQKDVIYVTGLVAKPGQIELPAGQDIHLLDAIAMAGGERSPVANHVLIIRRMENREEPVLIRASLMAAKKDGTENIRLAPGDTVSIEQTPATVLLDAVNRMFRMSVGVAGRTTFF